VNQLWRRVVTLFQGLSQSERLLISIAGGLALIVLLWLAVARPLASASQRADERVAAAERQVEAVRALRDRFDEIDGRLSNVERRIHEGPRGEIFTALEEMASQSAVKVASMEPRTSPASDEYRETKVQVGLKGVTLAQVVGYLHRIESSPQLLSIKSLRIRTRADQPELLEVTFTVSSFEPING
jgi:general secretion pathway protein M